MPLSYSYIFVKTQNVSTFEDGSEMRKRKSHSTKGVTMENEDVFLNTTFGDFMTAVILLTRSGGGSGGAKREIDYDSVTIHANKMNLKFPRQLYIDGEVRNNNGMISPH